MSKSSIEWTEQTWNPIVGCSILSPGCTNCYAMQMASRIEAMGNQPRYAGTTRKVNDKIVWTGKLAQAPEATLLQPLKRKKPTTWFVNSMGDLFHEDCPDQWIDRVFAVMALCPQHTFQVLTKRARRMWEYLSDGDVVERIAISAHKLWAAKLAPASTGNLSIEVVRDDDELKHVTETLCLWPLPNVWLGVSTERQQEADERIPLLLQTPAAVRFISAEPLLGAIDLTQTIYHGEAGYSMRGFLRDRTEPDDFRYHAAKLDWVIVGGESGSGARAMHPDWARSIRDQCQVAGVAFFFKQWGEWAPSTPDQAKGNPRSGWRTIKAHPHVARAEELYPEAGAAFIERVGKARAGRLLDGVEHNAMPAVHQ